MASEDPRPESRAADESGPRREYVGAAISVGVFLAFVSLAAWLVYSPTASQLGGDFTFFVLINASVVFVVVLAFLVGRGVMRLFLDRRRSVFGSSLRMRLAILFIVMSVAPSIVLVFVAREFVNVAIDAWFDARVRSALQGAVDVTDAYYLFTGDTTLGLAHGVAAAAAAEPGRTISAADLEHWRAERHLAALHWLDRDGAGDLRSQRPDIDEALPPIGAEFRDAVFAGGEIVTTVAIAGGDVIRAGVPVRDRNRAVRAAVVLDVWVPEDVAATAREVWSAYDDFMQSARLERPLRNQYTLTLIVIALTIAFTSMWVGLRQARNLTIPLKALAEGALEVARGNWKVEIAAARDVETNRLVEAFNSMTADLAASHAEIEARRKYAESILSNIAAGVVSLDRGGVVTRVNHAAEAMLGLRRDQAEGRHWSEVFSADALRSVGELVATLLQQPEKLSPCQIELTTGDAPITALVSATSLTDDVGAASGGMLFFENVTDLLRVQRMEAWREVARRLAHEIKNPLTPIKLSAQRLRRRYLERLDEADRGLLDQCTATIVSQVDAMQRLVSEFSTFARLPAVQLVPDDLNRVVGDAVALYRQGHAEVDFHFAPGAGLPPVALDRASLERVVINILDNAVAACEAVPERAARVEIATRHDADLDAVSLEITDNGCGMSADVKHRIFEPYFSTKGDGTGLGMAIAAAIVADHRGYIRVHDNQPHGSRLTIHLPAASGGAV